MKRLTFVFSNLLWIAVTATPGLDNRCPAIYDFPVTELLVLLLTPFLAVSFQALITAANGNQKSPSFTTRTIFSGTSAIVSMGVGVHAASLIVRYNLSPSDPVYELVQVKLHVLLSHNVFQAGYFAVMAAVVVTEAAARACRAKDNGKDNKDEKQDKNTTKAVSQRDAKQDRISSSSSSSASNSEVVGSKPTAPTNVDTLIEWVCAVILGIFYSRLAVATITVPITGAAMTAICALGIVWSEKEGGVKAWSVFVRSSSEDKWLQGTLSKACMLGLIFLPWLR